MVAALGRAQLIVDFYDGISGSQRPQQFLSTSISQQSKTFIFSDLTCGPLWEPAVHLEREMTEPVRIVQEFGAIENEAQSWSILAAESNARCTNMPG